MFTVGGLGPTDDDRTLQGVALGLGVALELHPEAERMVAEKYGEFHASGHVPFPEMTESRRKMARLPAGAEPIVNPIGGAPGVLCRSGATRIVSLPGVPGELKAIVDGSLTGLLGEVFGEAHYEERSLTVDLQDESAIADVLRRAEAAHPRVYVKSRAKVIGSVRALQITVSARAESTGELDDLLEAVTQQLLAGIGAAGYAVRRTPAADRTSDRRRLTPSPGPGPAAAGRRRRAAQPRWSSMKCVLTSPATNSGCSSTTRWKGITVFTPSTMNCSRAQRERARHSCRSRPHTMSLPSRLS